MNEYLKNISNIDSSGTSVSPSAAAGVESSILELPEDPPVVTSSSIIDHDVQPPQDNAQYLSPQKVILRKYTLKKGIICPQNQ